MPLYWQFVKTSYDRPMTNFYKSTSYEIFFGDPYWNNYMYLEFELFLPARTLIFIKRRWECRPLDRDRITWNLAKNNIQSSSIIHSVFEIYLDLRSESLGSIGPWISDKVKLYLFIQQSKLLCRKLKDNWITLHAQKVFLVLLVVSAVLLVLDIVSDQWNT